jgi:hypothetical protein
MRFWLFAFLVLTAAACVALSLTHGQERPAVAGPPPTTGPAPTTPPTPPAATGSRDLSHLTDGQKQVLLSCRRGADWLWSMNRADGRFRYGFVPALGRELEGDDYLRQVGAAFALARAARLTGEQRYEMRATQAILALLDETTVDEAKDAPVRHTRLPSALINRLGSAGHLVLAINELPSPKADLLEKSEQLCNYIRKQARTDGLLSCADAAGEGKPTADDGDGVNEYPGVALYALMLSQRHRPAAWKTELVRKAAAFYRPWWQKHKNMEFVPWQTAAYAEAYLATKEQAFAAFVNEMNDYLCEQQHTQTDQRHAEWRGGFRNSADGKPDAAPHVGSAVYAESLAHACRAARQAGDVKRFDRYSTAAGECVRFLTLLQYTEGNTTHFDDAYRKSLLGGFFAAHQDGNLRIDYSQHAVSALALYLEDVAR